VPTVRLAFLDAAEREAWSDTRAALDEGTAELARARAMQQDVQWGRRAMSEEMQERLRQYIAGRSELVTGDRLVLRSLGQRARQRQRLWLGLPLAVGGGAMVVIALLRRRAGPALGSGIRGAPSGISIEP